MMDIAILSQTAKSPRLGLQVEDIGLIQPQRPHPPFSQNGRVQAPSSQNGIRSWVKYELAGRTNIGRRSLTPVLQAHLTFC